MGHGPALTAVLTFCSRACPKTSRALPQFDVSCLEGVLSHSSGLRSQKRGTPCYHARSIQYDNKWKSISMSPHPGFISKTQLHTKGAHSLQKLLFPALLPFLGLDMSEDCSLCPVRVLKVSFAKMEDKRKQKELLFIPYKDPP